MAQPTTLELVTSRGLTLMLDGKRPDNGFNFGEADTGYITSQCEFGGSEVTGVDFNIEMEDYHEGSDPHTLTLEIDGEKIDYKVQQLVNGALLPTVAFANGEKRELDEHEVYIFASR